MNISIADKSWALIRHPWMTEDPIPVAITLTLILTTSVITQAIANYSVKIAVTIISGATYFLCIWIIGTMNFLRTYVT